MKDYYKILNLEPTIKIALITNRYHDLVEHFITRPDKEKIESTDFQLQSEAFYVLKNPKRKAIYDALHGELFENEPIQRVSQIATWKKTISDAAIEGKKFAEELVAMPTSELRKHLKSKIKTRGFTGGLGDLILFFLDIFAIFN